MTTTEQPALPEWEAEYHRYRTLPSIRKADWIHDPDFLHARLRDALTRAADIAAVQPDWRTHHELALLRMFVEDIADEIRQHTPAADEFLAILQSVAPEMHWFRTPRGFTTYSRDLEQSIQAARTLRLPEREKPFISRREWNGPIEGWSVTVNYIEPKQ